RITKSSPSKFSKSDMTAKDADVGVILVADAQADRIRAERVGHIVAVGLIRRRAHRVRRTLERAHTLERLNVGVALRIRLGAVRARAARIANLAGTDARARRVQAEAIGDARGIGSHIALHPLNTELRRAGAIVLFAAGLGAIVRSPVFGGHTK